MAKAATTIWTHTCDLCGRECPESDLATLYDLKGATGTKAHSTCADICPECTDKPIKEVLAFIGGEH